METLKVRISHWEIRMNEISLQIVSKKYPEDNEILQTIKQTNSQTLQEFLWQRNFVNFRPILLKLLLNNTKPESRSINDTTILNNVID